jgi:hypothetical protein
MTALKHFKTVLACALV